MAEAREAPEARLKRMKMRSMRRGIREMDLILGAFADTQLAEMAPAELINAILKALEDVGILKSS